MTADQPDPAPILADLGLTAVHSITPVTGGTDTLLWRVTTPAATYALRVFRPNQATGCAREARLHRWLADTDLPVPAVHAMGESGGRPALLLTWAAGQPLLTAIGRHPWRLWPLAVAFGQLQARLHALTPPADLDESERDWLAWAGPLPADLDRRLRALDRRRATLLHLDYHPLNVLTDGRRLTALLDWANARVGDPRADLARTISLLRLASAEASPITARERLGRRLLEAGWRRGYRQIAGPITGLRPFLAWAGIVLEHDLGPKLGDPARLEPIRRWTATMLRPR